MSAAAPSAAPVPARAFTFARRLEVLLVPTTPTVLKECSFFLYPRRSLLSYIRRLSPWPHTSPLQASTPSSPFVVAPEHLIGRIITHQRDALSRIFLSRGYRLRASRLRGDNAARTFRTGHRFA